MKNIETFGQFKELKKYMTPKEHAEKYNMDIDMYHDDCLFVIDFGGLYIEQLKKNGSYMLFLDRSEYKSLDLDILIKRLWYEFAQYEYGASMAGVHTTHETTHSLDEINIQTQYEFKCKSWEHDACDSAHNEDLDIEIYFPNEKEDINTFQVARISTADELLVTESIAETIEYIKTL